MNALFPLSSYNEILDLVDRIDPVAYCRNRNFVDGSVTRLSPYISRGVISTRTVLERTLARGFEPKTIEKFIQELAWRDYWQEFQRSRSSIDEDIRQAQEKIVSEELPVSIAQAETGIEGLDRGIRELFDQGYMHNHIRMYVASLVCNLAKTHWRSPSKWMYYHLLDADHASNTLSWQWVAGSNSGKCYLCNQENINKYCHTAQQNTFLDKPYEVIAEMEVPEELAQRCSIDLQTHLPEIKISEADAGHDLLVYNFYNLDPTWRTDQNAERVLLLEPSHFKQFPVHDRSIKFTLDLAQNISGISVHVGEFNELLELRQGANIRFKEHPLFAHYKGAADPPERMFDVKGEFRSFFAFWKKYAKQIHA